MSNLKTAKRGYTVEVAVSKLGCSPQWIYSTRAKALQDGLPCPFRAEMQRGVLMLDADRVDGLEAVDYCKRFLHKRNQAYHIDAVLDDSLASAVKPSPSGKGKGRVDTVLRSLFGRQPEVESPSVTEAEVETTQNYANDAFGAAERLKDRLDELELTIRGLQDNAGNSFNEHPKLPQLEAEWKALDRRYKRLLAHAWAANEDAENVRQQLEKSRPPVPPYLAKDSYVRALMQKHQPAEQVSNTDGGNWWDDDADSEPSVVSPEQRAAIAAVNDELSEPGNYKVCKRVPSDMSTITIRIAAKILHCTEHYLRCRLKSHPHLYPTFFVPPGTRRILFKRHEFDAWFDAQQQLKGAA